MNGNHCQSIKKILAEKSFFYALLEVAMSGDDNTNVHAPGTRRSNAKDLSIGQNPQQLGLRGQGHLTGFIKKEGPLVCGLKQSLSLAISTDNRAFFVAEQFAFQQTLGKRSAVHGDKVEDVQKGQDHIFTVVTATSQYRTRFVILALGKAGETAQTRREG